MDTNVNLFNILEGYIRIVLKEYDLTISFKKIKEISIGYYTYLLKFNERNEDQTQDQGQSLYNYLNYTAEESAKLFKILTETEETYFLNHGNIHSFNDLIIAILNDYYIKYTEAEEELEKGTDGYRNLLKKYVKYVENKFGEHLSLPETLLNVGEMKLLVNLLNEN